MNRPPILAVSAAQEKKADDKKSEAEAIEETQSVTHHTATIGGAVAYYVWNRLERITTTNDPNLKAADKQLAAVVDPATQPAVALVLGYDKRYGSGSARGHSDTLMLIRVDPKTKILSLLSLPRDLYVNVPGMGMRKINDAYAYGGAPLAIQTVSQVLGVKINYYVTDMAYTAELRRVRAGYLNQAGPPASTLVQVGLGKGLKVEIEVVALVPE
jgi:hypothetical protein